MKVFIIAFIIILAIIVLLSNGITRKAIRENVKINELRKINQREERKEIEDELNRIETELQERINESKPT